MKKSVQHKHHQQQLHPDSSSHLCYISKEVLVDRTLNAHLPTIIIDARDDDVVGGIINGAIFCPEKHFTYDKMLSLLAKAKKLRQAHNSGIIEHKAWVVFYCMESNKRSVRCARRFYNLVREAGDLDIISVKLLQGGADGFVRSYWNDQRLVEGYDDKYWGFAPEKRPHQQTDKKGSNIDEQQLHNQQTHLSISSEDSSVQEQVKE